MFKKSLEYLKQHRWLNWSIQFLLIIFIYIVIHNWKTRELIQGESRPVSGHLLSGEKFELHTLRGKPVLVHFWASWCPVCKLEQSGIASLAQDYQVLTIASWSGDAAEVQQYMTTENVQYPVLVDNDGSIARQWGVAAVPSSFFIDSHGNIRFVEQGYTSEYGFRLRLWWLQNF
jgi:peroxiredoxin